MIIDSPNQFLDREHGGQFWENADGWWCRVLETAELIGPYATRDEAFADCQGAIAEANRKDER